MLAMFQKIAAQLCLPGEPVSAERLSGGRVNETHRVRLRSAGLEKDYVFQRLSETAFREPERVMRNIAVVTKHLAGRGVPVQQYYHTPEGSALIRMDGLWRVTDYVWGRSYAAPDTPARLSEAGRAFGAFLRNLSDLDGATLCETIPRFHDTRGRLDDFFLHEACADVEKRAVLRPLTERLAALRAPASAVYDRCTASLPLRVTHNDTKCSNVLFSPGTDRFRMVIDLDTVMPGYAVYDFGDAVRSACTCEDGRTLSMQRFSDFSRGYLSEAAASLTPEEAALLAPAAMAVTAELAARYCDDWLTGAGYFQVSVPDGHLLRADALLSLAEDLLRRLPEMGRVLGNFL